MSVSSPNCEESWHTMAGKTEPYHMTAEEIAPHQVPVRGVLFIEEHRAITGDVWRLYRAPDGELIDVRVRCGDYAHDLPGTEPLTDEQAREHAVLELNQRRQGRARRIAAGEPVTCRLGGSGALAARLHGGHDGD